MTAKDFLHAALHVDLETVKKHVEAGVDINTADKNGATALILAILNHGNMPVASYLLKNGADFRIRQTSNDWRALTYAAINGHPEILQLLFEYGDAVTDDDWKALIFAVQFRHPDTVTMLLDAGMNVNVQDEDGKTAVMRAAKNSDKTMLPLLLSYGADVNLVDNNGMTALMVAAQRANVDNIKALLAAGADSSVKNNAGQTAVDIAQKKGRPKIIAALQ